MGEIIALRSSRAGRSPAPASGGAEILFFTGVRYHRMTDEEFAAASALRPRAPKPKATTVSHCLTRHG